MISKYNLDINVAHTIESLLRESDDSVDNSSNINIMIVLHSKTQNRVTFHGQDSFGSQKTITVYHDKFADYTVDLYDTIFVPNGAKIELPTAEIKGRVFIGWATAGSDVILDSPYTVNNTTTLYAKSVSGAFNVIYMLNNGEERTLSFVSSETLTAGLDKNGNSVVDNTGTGYTTIEWEIVSGEFAEQYVAGDTLTHGVGTFTFTSSVKLKEIVKGEDITFAFKDAEGNTLEYSKDSKTSFVVELGQMFKLPTQDDFTNATRDNKYIYGWRTEGEDTIKCNQDTNFEDLGYVYSDDAKLITLTAIYYNEYTYKFIYKIDNSSTTIPEHSMPIKAINERGEIGSETYTISSVDPINNNSNLVFRYYTLAINTIVVDNVYYGVGETIVLSQPANSSIYEYTYRLTAEWVADAGTSLINVYITNPLNEQEFLKVNIENEEFESYEHRVNISSGLRSSQMPVFEPKAEYGESIEWKADGSSLFTTTTNIGDDIGLVAWKLIGYNIKCYNNESVLQKTIELLFANNNMQAIGGYARYEAYAIWESRYYIRYYQTSELYSTEYYDANSTVTLPDNEDEEYSHLELPNCHVIGLTEIESMVVDSLDDIYAFGSQIVVNRNYNLYPANAKIYTITFNAVSNIEDLEVAYGFDKSQIALPEVFNGEYSYASGYTIWLGLTVNLSELFTFSYNGKGYEFAGFTFASDKLFDSSDDLDIISNIYFDNEDQVVISENQINVYVAWSKIAYEVIFNLEAELNNNDDVGSTIKVPYPYYTVADFSSNDKVIDAINAVLGYKCFNLDINLYMGKVHYN